MIVGNKNKFGFIVKKLNLGGGFGVRYVESDPVIDYEKNIKGNLKFFAELSIL